MFRVVAEQESRLRLSAAGRWYHRGEPFTNERIIAFFHQAIRSDEAGRYFLFNVVEGKEEHVYFEVEDTAYFVMRIDFDEQHESFTATLNTQARETLDLHRLEEDQQGVMYYRLREGDRARVLEAALTHLADYAQEDEAGIFITRNGQKIYVSKGGPDR